MNSNQLLTSTNTISFKLGQMNVREVAYEISLSHLIDVIFLSLVRSYLKDI